MAASIDARVEAVLAAPAHPSDVGADHGFFFALVKDQIADAAARCPPYRNFVDHWPVALGEAASLADLPALPVAVFKQALHLVLAESVEPLRTVASSATTGAQPSVVHLDAVTARRMGRAAAQTLAGAVGSGRRPLLVVDRAPNNGPGGLRARTAAARALAPFARPAVYACVRRQR